MASTGEVEVAHCEVPEPAGAAVQRKKLATVYWRKLVPVQVASPPPKKLVDEAEMKEL